MKIRSAFVTLVGIGCAAGSGTGSRPAAEFPSRTELAALPSKAAPRTAFPTKDVVVESWTFQEATPP